MRIILTDQKCEACEGGIPPLTPAEVVELHTETPEWIVAPDSKSISREYVLADFNAVIRFINQIADLAEREGHHPDLHLTDYKHLTINLSTHAIGGLSKNDFILAAKIDAIGI